MPKPWEASPDAHSAGGQVPATGGATGPGDIAGNGGSADVDAKDYVPATGGVTISSGGIRTGGAINTDGGAMAGGITSSTGGASTGGNPITGGVVSLGGASMGGGTSSPDVRPMDTAIPDTLPVVPDLGLDAIRDTAKPDTAVNLSNGLLVHYPSDSVQSDNRLLDVSGRGNHGQVVGGYKLLPGKVGRSLSLFGNVDAGIGDGYVVLPPNLLANAKSASVAMWFLPNSKIPWQRLLELSSTESRAFAITPFDADTPQCFRFEITAGGEVKKFLNGPDLKLGEWRHVVLVMDATSVRMYFEGELAVTSTLISKRPADVGNTTFNFIGRSQFDWDPYYDGRIDEFRLYDRALTVDEIKALYAM